MRCLFELAVFGHVSESEKRSSGDRILLSIAQVVKATLPSMISMIPTLLGFLLELHVDPLGNSVYVNFTNVPPRIQRGQCGQHIKPEEKGEVTITSFVLLLHHKQAFSPSLSRSLVSKANAFPPGNCWPRPFGSTRLGCQFVQRPWN